MLRAILLTFLVLPACGDSDAAPDAAIDAFVPPDTSSQCTPLALSGSRISVDQVATAPPAPQGGTIVPGTYVLVSATQYTGPGGATGASGISLRITTTNDGVHQYKNVSEVTGPSGTTLSDSAGTFTTAGTSFALTSACPPSGTTTLAYSATPTQVTLYAADPNLTTANVYAKQ